MDNKNSKYKVISERRVRVGTRVLDSVRVRKGDVQIDVLVRDKQIVLPERLYLYDFNELLAVVKDYINENKEHTIR